MATHWVKRLSFRGLAVGMALVAGSAALAVSADAKSRALFGEGQGGQIASGGSRPKTEVRGRRVKVDIAALAGADLPDGAETIELNLFADKKFEAKKSRFKRRDNKHFTWFGTVQDDPLSSVVLVAGDGQMQGLVFAHGKHFSIQGADAASQEVVEIDQSAFPQENCDQGPAGDAAPGAPALPTAPDTAADTGSTIDVLVVYTPAARTAVGGATAMRLLAELAVDDTNESYAYSFITPRLNLVHAQEVAYTESASFGTDLDRLKETSDGFMDTVHALRDAYKADVVVLLIKNPTSCGIAYIEATAATAFAVVAWHCVAGNYSFGHEIGHLQGARHDWYVDQTPGYNHGDVDLASRQRTVMAYRDQCLATAPKTDCPRLRYWSNPNLPYPGTATPMGSAARENNVRVLNESAYTVANFKLQAVQLTVRSTYPATGVSIATVSPADNNGTDSGTTPFTLDYNANTTVTLTAEDPNGGGFSFLNWSGCPSPSGAVCTVTMDGNKTVTANYETPNYLPALDAIADLTVDEDAGVTVELSGISAGPPSESGQTLVVTAISSDPGLVDNPLEVDYTSPGTTGILSVTPVPDAYGTATITVTVDDGMGGGYHSVERTFLVTVNAVNDAPGFLAGADQTVFEDSGAPPVAGWATLISAGPGNESAQTLVFTTTNNNNPLFSVQPAVATDGTLTFTPAANASGTADVTVRLHDSGGTASGGVDTSAPQHVTIEVTAVNDPPTLNTLPNRTISEEAAWQTVALSGISAGGGESQTPLTVTAASSETWLIPDPTVIYTSPGKTGSLRFKPLANAFGTATITVTVDDGQSENATFARSFNVTVKGVNDPPTLNSIPNLTIAKNAGEQTVALNGISAGVGGESQPLTVRAVSSKTSLIPNPTVSYTSPDGTGSLTFTPRPNAYGAARITVTVKDGQPANNTVTRSFVVTVNDPPTLNALGDLEINEDAGRQIVALSGITAGAGERQALKVTALSSNPGLVPNPRVSYVSPAAKGNLIFSPVANAPAASASDTATVTVTVNDGQRGNNISTQSFVVTVNAVNDAPTLNAISNRTIREDAVQQTVFLSGIGAGGGESQPLDKPLAVTAVSSNPGLIPDPTVHYADFDTAGSLNFTPLPNAYGRATITVTVDDQQDSNNTFARSFVVRVIRVNDAPSFVIGADQTVLEDAGAQQVTGWATSISAGPPDESAQTLVFLTTNDNPGLFSVQPAVASGGTLSFRPAANTSGSATVKVRLRDNGGTDYGGVNTSAPQYFTITVTAVNDAPTLNAISNRTISEDAAWQTVALSGISAGRREKQTPLTVTAASSAIGLIPEPTVIYTSPGTTGSLRFKPVADAFGTATITVTVDDHQGENNTFARTFLVKVNGVNDRPTLTRPDDLTIAENAGEQTVALAGISAGAGGESQTLTVTAVSSRTSLIPKPTVVYSSPDATGNLRFTPVPNARGTATITVKVNDHQSANNTVAQSFLVTVVDPATLSDAPLQEMSANLTAVSASFVGVVNGVADENPSGPAPLNVTFDAAGSAGPDPIVSYHWDFGDLQEADTATPTVTHGYTATGSYLVTLTVADAGGGTDSIQRLVSVADAIQTAATAAGFQEALEIAGANGRHDIIRLAGGTYALSGNAGGHFAYSSVEDKDLVIEGGWTPDFSQRAANIPTELTNDVPVTQAGAGGVLEISSGGSVGVDGIAVSGGTAAGSGGGLHITAAGSIAVGNSRILNNAAGGDGGGLFLESTGGDIRLYGSTIRGNSGASGGGGLVKALAASVYSNEISGNAALVKDGGLQASVISGGGLIVSNNTIYGNQAPAGSSGLSVGATGTRGLSVLDIRNNIVYGNGAATNFVVAPDSDCVLNYLDLNIVNNDIECYKMCPEYLLDGSNISVDFSGRPAGTIRLAAGDAALIDQGWAYTVPFEDIEGDAIPLAGPGAASAVPDIGADEYNPENIAGPAAMTVAASGSIAAANGSATITVLLDRPAKRDVVLFLSSGDAAAVTLTTPYLKILKGLNSARTVVQAAGGARSGVSTITVTDPSGWIEQGSVTVDIVE